MARCECLPIRVNKIVRPLLGKRLIPGHNGSPDGRSERPWPKADGGFGRQKCRGEHPPCLWSVRLAPRLDG